VDRRVEGEAEAADRVIEELCAQVPGELEVVEARREGEERRRRL
jgi:hypothetical protein